MFVLDNTSTKLSFNHHTNKNAIHVQLFMPHDRDKSKTF